MPGPLHCVCLCFLLRGSEAFAWNVSNQHRLPNVTEDQEDVADPGWESPFLQLRASLPSFSQPMRPYALLTSAEDHRKMPKPRRRRPSRLLRLLGPSFDPFWMSVEQPHEVHRGDSLHVRLLQGKSSPALREAAANQRRTLEVEAAALDLAPLPSDVARSLGSWLVSSATCDLHYQWKDLGPAFWPRWLRQTDCGGGGGSGTSGSCSFPAGMACVRAQTAHVKILAWHCLEIARDDGGGSGKTKSERKNNGSAGVAETSCLWRQVPYPVVTACKCSCP